MVSTILVVGFVEAEIVKTDGAVFCSLAFVPFCAFEILDVDGALEEEATDFDTFFGAGFVSFCVPRAGKSSVE